jgi:hypothetical protein
MHPAMARATISLALLLAAASLVGCGGHGRAPRAGTGRRAASGGPLTQARALAFARAVNLTASDVPGFSAARRSAPPPRKRAEGELFRCAGGRGAPRHGRAGDVAQAGSPSFELRRGIIDLGVSSEVGVARSPALADAELAALHSGRVRACFQRYLDSVLAAGRPSRTNVGPVAIESGSPPATGAAGSFGWRVRASFRLDGVSVPVYLDLLGFVYGPARVTLVSSGALRPFPALAQQRLFSLLLLRARANGI